MFYSNIKLSQIDGEDRLFYVHHLNDPVQQWDGRLSLYNPIWLQEKEPDIFRIIDGFKVYELAKDYTPDGSIPARIFPENSSLAQLWEQRVQKRKLENNLSTMAYLEGLLRMMKRLKLASYPDDTNSGYLLPEIGQKTLTREMLQNLIDMSQFYKAFTDIHQLGYNEIKLLSSKSEQDLTALSSLLKEMQLKGNKLTSLIHLIDELNRGYKISLSDILKDRELTSIRESYAAHQRYRHIKSHLLTLRFPELNNLLAQWNDSVKRIGLDSIVDIRHDPYFEDDHLQFVFSSRTVTELTKQLQQVLEKSSSKELEHLFNFI